MNGRVFGGRCSGLLASWSLGSLSWRTSQRCLFGGFQMFLDRWPRSGMMQNGQLFLLRNVERPTEGTGYSSLPTPCATDATNERDSRKRFNRLGTPDYNEKKTANPACQNLYTAVTKLLPTPVKSDVDKHPTGGLIRRLTYPEGQQVYSKGDPRNLPTPTKHLAKETGATSEWHRNGPALITQFIKPDLDIGERPRLNPQFVEHMMGFPIGWTSLEHSEMPSCPNAQNGSDEE